MFRIGGFWSWSSGSAVQAEEAVGGYLLPVKKKRRKTKKELAEEVKAQRIALGILEPEPQHQIPSRPTLVKKKSKAINLSSLSEEEKEGIQYELLSALGIKSLPIEAKLSEIEIENEEEYRLLMKYAKYIDLF